MTVAVNGIRRPATWRTSDSHAQRLDDLERPIVPDGQPARERFEVDFVYGDALAAFTFPRWYAWFACRLNVVFFSLENAGSSASTFKVLVNGSALTPLGVSGSVTVSGTTLTMPSGAHTGKAYFDQAFTPDVDYLQQQIVSVGAGAAGLNAQHRFG